MNTEVHEPSPKYLLVRAGYQQSDVGLIPQEWSVKELRQIGNLSKGRGLLKEDIANSGAVPAIPYTALYTDFSEVVDYGRIKWFVDDIAGTIVVNEPCVLIASSSNMAANTGKASAIPGTTPVAIGREVIIFRTDHSAVFFSYLLSTAPYRKRTLVLARGTTIKHLYPATFANYRVAVPPLAEQLAITEVLGNVDALLVGLERLIAKKRNIKQAAMQQLLTGQTRLPGFSGEWTTAELGDVAAIRNIKVIAANAPNGTKCVELESIDQGTGQLLGSFEAAGATPKYTFKAGDVLFGRLRAYLRKYWFATFDGVCSTEIWPLIPRDSRLATAFLHLVVQTEEFIDAAAISYGTHMPRSDWSVLTRLSFQLPSLEEQTAIATVLSDMDAELSALDARLIKTRAIKQGMMQELLTGRTRLVDSTEQVPAQELASAPERKANVHFLRSVFAAEIVDQLHHEPTFGHVKFEKMLFLAEHLCQVDTGSIYLRKAAGPLDRKALHSIDSQLRTQKWFDGRKEEGRYRYVPMEKRGGHKGYFDRHFASIGSQLSDIVETFRTWNTERCEIVATLYAAWNDLLHDKGAASDDMILHEVLNNWHESKQRIPEDRWRKALGWMREKGYVPNPVAGASHD